MKTSMLLLALASGCCFCFASCDKNQNTVKTDTSTTFPATVTATMPDNTAVNRRDQNTTAMTPMDQSEDAADIKVAAEIRRAVMDDKGLSTNAHNAKIITSKGGAVTLRGVVDSAAEKDSIEAKAKAVSGVSSVDNQLEVKNP